jgi:integrase
MGTAPPPIHHCPPPVSSDLPILREYLSKANAKVATLAMAVAATGRRAADVRMMRWQDVRLGEHLWLYRPGRCLPLPPATCTALGTLPQCGPWVFPLSWRRTDHPWSEDAVEACWLRFRRTLPGALRHLTLSGLRASREDWLKLEEQEAPFHSMHTAVPFHVRKKLPDLLALVEKIRDGGTEAGDGMPLREIAELYFQYQLAEKPSYDLARRTFYAEFSTWLARPVVSIRKLEIIHWHASRWSAPTQANRGLGLLRSMINWAIGFDLLSCANPTAGIRKHRVHNRTRYVEPDEMPKLLWTLKTASARDRAFFFTCLFTAARSGEVRAMEWQNVDLQRRIWVMPITKNGKPHRVPLPTQVIEALQVLPRHGRWVFPGVAGNHLSASTPRKAWDAIRRVAGLPDVTVHDLRRSAATWLASQNVNLSIIQHALNHSSLQPTAIYARMHLSSLDQALQGMTDQMQQASRLIESVSDGPNEG